MENCCAIRLVVWPKRDGLGCGVKISFDLDGVLYEKPDFYISLCMALKAGGAELGVLTGHTHESGERTLDKLEQMGYPRFDFFFGRRPEDIPFNGAVRKSQVIRDEGIDLHFDDYDFDWPDTVELFAGGGQENRILRVRSCESGKLGRTSI
jgi:hypothetical protein